MDLLLFLQNNYSGTRFNFCFHSSLLNELSLNFHSGWKNLISSTRSVFFQSLNHCSHAAMKRFCETSCDTRFNPRGKRTRNQTVTSIFKTVSSPCSTLPSFSSSLPPSIPFFPPSLYSLLSSLPLSISLFLSVRSKYCRLKSHVVKKQAQMTQNLERTSLVENVPFGICELLLAFKSKLGRVHAILYGILLKGPLAKGPKARA